MFVLACDLEDLGAQVREMYAGVSFGALDPWPVWLHFSLLESLNVIQPLPVWASVRIMRL